MVTSENFGSFFGPIWGALSDAAVGSDGRRRRRPIIVFGQCLFVGACVLMATADSFYVLLLSYMLFTFTATLSGAPYTVTNTVVPLEQRGLYNAMWSYQSLVVGFITSALYVQRAAASASANPSCPVLLPVVGSYRGPHLASFALRCAPSC
jgi:MFS family permease